MKKPTLAWAAKHNTTGEIWPMWINISKESLKSDIRSHGLDRAVKIIRVEIKEVVRRRGK